VSTHEGKVEADTIRKVFAAHTQWAEAVCEAERRQGGFDTTLQKIPPPQRDFIFQELRTSGHLARFYRKPGITEIEAWHDKLGHIGAGALRRCQIKNLSIPKTPFRCEACIKGKMHRLGHSSKNPEREIFYKPGEYIQTDLQGPYTNSVGGAKYSQIFIDFASRKLWTVRLKNKTESDDAIESVLADAQARSGRKCKILRTDGDGIFGRSKSFQELQKKLNFVHERPAPYDHEQSALVDRECRTLLESTATVLIQSGAPSNFWALAAAHYTFTRNATPRHERNFDRRKFFISSNDFFEGREQSSFNLKNLVAFGTQATCFIPPARREGKENTWPKEKF